MGLVIKEELLLISKCFQPQLRYNYVYDFSIQKVC